MIQRFFLMILVVTLFTNCKTYNLKHLKSGDLIFVESNEQQLSGAISRVTKSIKIPVSYDHLGLIEKTEKGTFVLHAAPKKGATKEKLSVFMAEHRGTKLEVFRLKNKYMQGIPLAIEKANTMLGKPYNHLYIPTDTAYYCSDFVQRAFNDTDIFELEPMTFKNPTTGEIDDYWQEFYQAYDVDVPEGQLGCNPNGMSRSNKLKKLFTIN